MTWQIHPTVIMSISEHHTRAQAIRQQSEIVIGALLGTKDDRNVEIVDSFALKFTKDPQTDDSRSFVIDREFYQRKIPLVKQVNPELDLIGWYATTPVIQSQVSREGDVSLHRQISEFIPNPIFIKFNPYKRDEDPKISAALPLNIYEPVIEIDPLGEKVNFIEVPWTVVTDDIEIIGLEHNVRATDQNEGPSLAYDNLKLRHSAVKMLKDRVRVMSKYVKDVQAGTLPMCEETMKQIAHLCSRFPLMNSQEYIRSFNIQCNDVALNTYLGILTKGSMFKMMSATPPYSKKSAYPYTHARR